jgi:hypothetical protein
MVRMAGVLAGGQKPIWPVEVSGITLGALCSSRVPQMERESLGQLTSRVSASASVTMKSGQVGGSQEQWAVRGKLAG